MSRSAADRPIFASAPPLPRGPHSLSREEVASSQRERILAAFTTLLAGHGYGHVLIGELAREAGVSRATFYEHFEDKYQCLLAAYRRFIDTLLAGMIGTTDPNLPWDQFLEAMLEGYLGTLQRDLVSARAFIVEMEASGAAARQRRREEIHHFAQLLARHHDTFRAADSTLGPLPPRAWLAIALATRELVRDALETNAQPELTALAADIRRLIIAAVRGA